VSVHRAIQEIDRPVFTTREIATMAGTSLSSASQALSRMQKERLVTRAARGIWCQTADPRFTPFLLVPYLSGGHQAYVSFFSALHLHGLIGQIPQVVYAATTAHTRRRQTPLGMFSYHRIDPRFFSGFDWYCGGRSFLIAGPEKALVDCLYLSSRKGRRFGRFPEIELGARFSKRRAREWVKKIPYQKIRGHVQEKLSALLESSS
jgi:predicted transcriptional regulator of viral defense system